MKHSLRCSALLIVLMCALAWTLAPQRPEAETGKTEERVEQAGGLDRARTLRVLAYGEAHTMDMAEYLTGVLRAEMPASFELEALKAQAVAARSYTLHKMRSGSIAAHPDFDACDDVGCCKAFMSESAAAQGWGEMAEEYEKKLERAVAETDGEVLLYEGESVLAVFFSSSAGRTQGAQEVWQDELPYLKSVESPETAAIVPNYYSTVHFTADEFRSLLAAAYPQADTSRRRCIDSITRNDAHYVSRVETLGLTLRGNELRAVLGLRSPYFEVEESGDELVFHVTGYGHGVGLSQYGANAMAKDGADYRGILTHYYVGTEIEKAE